MKIRLSLESLDQGRIRQMWHFSLQALVAFGRNRMVIYIIASELHNKFPLLFFVSS